MSDCFSIPECDMEPKIAYPLNDPASLVTAKVLLLSPAPWHRWFQGLYCTSTVPEDVKLLRSSPVLSLLTFLKGMNIDKSAPHGLHVFAAETIIPLVHSLLPATKILSQRQQATSSLRPHEEACIALGHTGRLSTTETRHDWTQQTCVESTAMWDHEYQVGNDKRRTTIIHVEAPATVRRAPATKSFLRYNRAPQQTNNRVTWGIRAELQ